MSNSTIVTGGFVRIEQTPASLSDRIFAVLIDYGVCFCYAVGVFQLFIKLDVDVHSFVEFFLWVAPVLFYPLYMEVLNGGRTLGKMVMKTRVVMVDGTTPSIGAYLLRWLLIIADGPMICYLGVLFVAVTKLNQRIGDLAAGTMVVKEGKYKNYRINLDEYDYLTKNYKPTYPQADELTMAQSELISRVLTLRDDSRPMRISELAGKIRSSFGIKEVAQPDEEFLNTILQDYQYYALEAEI
ncbi:MAG: RDD family protein [Bacteroidaceae bacterium]|nr:RDD family protein [Bacteroidaceae bacterium]